MTTQPTETQKQAAVTEASNELAYAAIKNSMLFQMLDNHVIDKLAEKLGDELVVRANELVDREIETRVKAISDEYEHLDELEYVR
jgi:hypothetical protein